MWHPVPGLPVTGGQLMGGVAGAAVLLLAAGAGVLAMVRRRRPSRIE
ncbi:LPXTG cell wall anchor domain-containing protein [Leucobacter massiliensis]|nr:LPXTG cell wall anchor domain-containing protein [Leucobacter massiliensis]